MDNAPLFEAYNLVKCYVPNTPPALAVNLVFPAGKIIGLDSRYALEMVKGGEVTVEYDKLIDRQLERAAITSIAGFAKLFTDAARVLTV